MAITFDAFSADGTPTTGNDSFTHAGGAGPRTALVFIVGTSPTDEITGVTYATVAMTQLASSPKISSAGGEPGVIHTFLLNGITSGSQTVAFTTSASTVTHQGYCITLNAAADLEVVDEDVTIDSISLANPSVTLSLGGRSCFCALALMSGQAAVASITPLTSWTSRHEVTTGSECAACYTYDTIGTTDVTAGWTQTADDALMYAVALGEVVAAGGQPTVKRHGGVPGMNRLRMGPGFGGGAWGRTRSGVTIPRWLEGQRAA